MADDEGRSQRTARKYAHVSNIIIKQEIRARMKQVNMILKKPVDERTSEELRVLDQSPEMANAVQKRSKHRQLAKDRTQEVEDAPEILAEKCQQLAEAITAAKNVIIYTGAGISTAASIPDYRGPNGVWTLLQKGVPIKDQDLSDAEPTFTHMSITKLHQVGKVNHVVSQNCDGLHLRSGFPRHCLSEVHGNMYIEICKNCKPWREHIRLFDVTERTAVRRHHTGRMCRTCGEELRDTIIHFGEKAPFMSPYNWEEAAQRADKTDLILCLGSSLKVMKKYGCLWNVHKPPCERPKLFIVNLQWTPKDSAATVKINGRCDDVMRQLMMLLGHEVPPYERELDPIFSLAFDLYPLELKTTSKKILVKHLCLDNNSNSTEVSAAEKQDTKLDIKQALPQPTAAAATSTTTSISTVAHMEFTEAPIKTKPVPIKDEQIRNILSAPLTPSPIVANEISISSSCIHDDESAAVRALIRSRLQSKMAKDEQPPAEAYNLILNEAQDGDERESTEKPSDKYKLIKYLLNKPADIADEKLQQLTSRLRDTCESVMYQNSNTCSSSMPSSSQTQNSGLILYTTANSKPVSVRSTYPTLVGALMSLKHPGPICSTGQDGQQTAARTHSTGTNYQPTMGIHCQTDSVDAISKLRSLMEGRPKMEPLLIETEASAGSRSMQQHHLAATLNGSTEGLLTTVIPPGDREAMLFAYSMDSAPANLTGTQPAEQSTKRYSDALDGTAGDDVDNTDIEQSENISPSHTGSVPGWFGKGLNVRKKKKRVR